MDLLGMLLGHRYETDDQREEREYNEQNRHTDADFTRVCGCSSCLTVEDVFTLAGRGTVAVGKVTDGSFTVGDSVTVDNGGEQFKAVIKGIESFRKALNTASEGDNAGFLLSGIDKNQLKRGDLIIK